MTPKKTAFGNSPLKSAMTPNNLFKKKVDQKLPDGNSILGKGFDPKMLAQSLLKKGFKPKKKTKKKKNKKRKLYAFFFLYP